MTMKMAMFGNGNVKTRTQTKSITHSLATQPDFEPLL